MDSHGEGQNVIPGILRIHGEDPALLDDGDLLTYNGQPFTGMSYEEYSDGTLWDESLYKDGWPAGYSRVWYPNGQVMEESDWEKGKAYSIILSWYPNGKLRSRIHAEWEIIFESKEWDEDGNLIKNIERDYDDPNRVAARKRNTR